MLCRKVYISLAGVKELLAQDAPWLDALFLQATQPAAPAAAGAAATAALVDIEFGQFMDFLETGKLVPTANCLLRHLVCSDTLGCAVLCCAVLCCAVLCCTLRHFIDCLRT